jgi:hypothetical protein
MKTWLSDEDAKAICRHRAKSNDYIRRQLSSGTQVPRATWMQWAHEYDAVRTILQTLARVCDGAKSHDGCGFNKHDSRKGKQLAYQSELTNEEFWIGVRIVRKYHQQINPALMAWIPRSRKSNSPGS